MVMGGTNDSDLVARQRECQRVGGGDAGLGLHFETFLFLGATNRNQLLEDAFLPLNEKRVDAVGDLLSGPPEVVLVQRQQPPVPHQPAAVTHRVNHVGRFGGVHELRVDRVRIAGEAGPVMGLVELNHDQVGSLSDLQRAGHIANDGAGAIWSPWRAPAAPAAASDHR